MTSNCSWPTAPTTKSAADQRPEELGDALFGQALQGLLQVLGLERIGTRTRRRISGAKLGRPAKRSVAGLREAVADPQDAMVGDADDVAGVGLLGQLAVGGEEQDRRVDAHLAAGVLDLQFHARG